MPTYNKAPYAHRPLRNMYLAIANVLSTDRYLEMDENQFISAVMKASNGSSNPRLIRNIYFDLRKDSGI